MRYRAILAVLIALGAVLSAAAVSAQFDVSYTVLHNRILPSGTANFTFTVRNNLTTPDRLRLTLNDVNWIVRTEPQQYYFTGIALKPGAQTNFTLTLKPTANLPVSKYLLDLRFFSEATNLSKVVRLQVAVTRPDGTVGQYLATVSRLLEFPSQVDPRKELTITVNLQNRNVLNISNFTVFVHSSLFNVSNSTQLGPLESKKLLLHVHLPPDTPPQTVKLTTSFEANGQLLRDRFYDSFDIVPYRDVNVTKITSRGFFKTTRTLSYANRANAPANVSGQLPVNFFSRLFSSVRIDGQRASKTVVSNESGTYLRWSFPLGTGASKTVTVTANYSLLFWIAVIIIAAIVVYYLMRSPISVRKDAVVVGVSEGGISEIRVVVHLKNLSPRKFVHLSVIDSIPKIAEYVPEKEESLHTLRVYTNQREGSVVKWSLETLERYEERILTYRIRSKLSIVGGITLPRTLIRFTDDSGQEQVTRSNSERVSL